MRQASLRRDSHQTLPSIPAVFDLLGIILDTNPYDDALPQGKRIWRRPADTRQPDGGVFLRFKPPSRDACRQSHSDYPAMPRVAASSINP